MRSGKLRAILTVGLMLKALALLAVVAWPLFSSQPEPAEAQEAKPAAASAKPATPQAKAPAATKADPSAPAKAAADPAQAPEPGEKEAAVEGGVDQRVLSLLEQQRAELAVEKIRIERERKDLEALRNEVNQRVEELKRVQAALDDLVGAERQKRKERVQQLVKVLANMKPAAAAAVVTRLDDQMAVEIFQLLQSRIAGQVMANLEPKQAARIGVLLARHKETQEAGALATQAAGDLAPAAPAAPAPAAPPEAAPEAPAAPAAPAAPTGRQQPKR